MERVTLIEAIPLSVPRTLEGVFYWYEDFLKLKEKPRNVIIGNIDQNPELLLVKDYVQGYLIKHGGFTAHLAIVGRELGIPVYRYNNLDKLVSGQKIIVVPVQPNKIEFPDTYVWTIRQIKEDRESLFKNMHDVFTSSYILIRRLNEFFKVERFFIEYNPDKNERIVYVYIKTVNMRERFEDIIRNPRKYLEWLESTEIDVGISFICKFLAEVLTPYLMQQVGIDRALKAIHRHTPYWTQIHEEYLKIRFGITDKSVKEYLRSLVKESKRETVKLEEPYDTLARFIGKCIEVFESKNYEFKK